MLAGVLSLTLYPLFGRTGQPNMHFPEIIYIQRQDQSLCLDPANFLV